MEKKTHLWIIRLSDISNALRLIKQQPKGYERQFRGLVLTNSHCRITGCIFTSFTLLDHRLLLCDAMLKDILPMTFLKTIAFSLDFWMKRLCEPVIDEELWGANQQFGPSSDPLL